MFSLLSVLDHLQAQDDIAQEQSIKAGDIVNVYRIVCVCVCTG